jgi:hypothetical protein
MDRNAQRVANEDIDMARERPAQAKRPYRAPEIMVMDEKEVLKIFQITSAGISWWG